MRMDKILRVAGDTHRALKGLAWSQDKQINELADEAIREYLAKNEPVLSALKQVEETAQRAAG